jgi:hypothetical protein
MHNGGGGTGHGGGGHHGGQTGGQHGVQHPGQHHQHPGHQNGHHQRHGHLNGGIPANSPASSVNWATAMNGTQEKRWIRELKASKLQLLAVAAIGMFFVMWLFVIDYSNRTDRAARASGSGYSQSAAQAPAAMPMQQVDTANSAVMPNAVEQNFLSQGNVPAAFGSPRSSYGASAASQDYSSQTPFGSPAASQSAAGVYPSYNQSAMPQSFQAPATRFGQPQQNVARTHTLERHRMVVNR